MRGRIFAKILLKKENVQLFLYLKEKGCKKKQPSLLLDRLSILCFEARRSLRKSPRRGAELFACRNRQNCFGRHAVLRPTVASMGAFFDTLTRQQIFPPSYLAPNGLNQRSANLSPYSEGIKSDLGGVIVLFVHPKKSCHTIKILQRTDERRNSFRQANSVTLVTLSRRASGLCGIKPDSPSTCRVANFFFETFFFLGKKKVERFSFAKGKFFKRIFYKNLFYTSFLSTVHC